MKKATSLYESTSSREDQGAMVMVIATERRRGGSEQTSQRVLRKACSSFRSGYTRAQAHSLEAVRARTRPPNVRASSNGLLRQAGASVAMQKAAIGGLTTTPNGARACSPSQTALDGHWTETIPRSQLRA